MRKLFVILFSLALLLTSSCAVKRFMMQSVGLETSKTAKGSNNPFVNFSSTSESCTSTANFEGIFTTAAQSSDHSNNVFLLFTVAVLLLSGGIIFFTLPKLPNFSFSTNSVPIYLRIGKLIYYN